MTTTSGLSTALLAVATVIVPASTAFAVCSCACVNGQVQPICSSSYDSRPICVSRPCAIVPNSVPPMASRRPPLIGSTSCRMEQVETGRGYSWERVCRIGRR